MNKPKLSFWRIWNLSFGFLGVQIGYSLQNSNTSSIFESLGADVSHLSYFWLAAPLAGMIVQPTWGFFPTAPGRAGAAAYPTSWAGR